MEITKSACKLILTTMINENMDINKWSFLVDLDHEKKQTYITFTKEPYNIKNIHGLNVVVSDHMNGVIIDSGTNQGVEGLIFRN